jgi:hypothetical protein
MREIKRETKKRKEKNVETSKPRRGFCSLGGLDLSRLGLDRHSRSRQFEKVDLDVTDNLDTLKKLVSTLRTFSTVQKPSLKSLDYSKNRDFSIFVEISIETLDLDSLKKLIST